MLGLVAAFAFLGYTLVYAAVANGGKLAARPWDALREDAYTGSSPTTAGASSPSIGSKIGSAIEGLIPGGTIVGPLIGKAVGGILGGHHGTTDPSGEVHREVK